MKIRRAYLLFLCLGLSCQTGQKHEQGPIVRIPVEETFQALIQNDDRDHDNKITLHDEPNLSFTLVDQTTKKSFPIEGHYPLSVLLQELTLARDGHKKDLSFSLSELNEDPEARTSRMIREVMWPGLTRRLDETGLSQMIDPKLPNQKIYVYVPANDPQAFSYYKKIEARLRKKKVAIEVQKLPLNVDAKFVESLSGKHGLLTLGLNFDERGQVTGAKPFVVPGGRFNEMYGWDSYFIILGLLNDGEIALARSMVENLTYEIDHYGKILNANRTYYLTRSQPPFTTSAIRAVYEKLPDAPESKAWLLRMMKSAYREYNTVWMRSPHLITLYNLSRYAGEGNGPCPEVEPGHYKEAYAKYSGQALQDFFRQDRALRESGHDTTYRFDDRALDFLTVDLNSLLYKIESDFADLIEAGLIPSDGSLGLLSEWKNRRDHRKKKIYDLMYDANSGLFYDYDMKNQVRSDYLSATTFYPLWAGLVDKEQAIKLKDSAFKELLQPGGLSATAPSSQQKHGIKTGERQWEYPNGWAPHQMMAWQGLHNYGLYEDEKNLIERWLKMITDNARDYNGTIPEKYNVVTRSHAVFEEYGNVGTQFDYITRQGFGWVNASFQVGRKRLGR